MVIFFNSFLTKAKFNNFLSLRRIELFLLFFLSFSLSACVSVKVSSAKDDSFDEKIDSVLVVMQGAELADNFFVTFKNQMKEALETRDIRVEFLVLDSKDGKNIRLSLNPDEYSADNIEKTIVKTTNESNVNFILSVNQIEMKTIVGSLNAREGGVFDVRLLKAKELSLVWRAELDMFSNNGFSQGATLSSKRLIEQLEQDEII